MVCPCWWKVIALAHTCVLAHGFIEIQYIPRNMHTVFALLCFVVVIHWLIFPYPSGLLHWHCGNLAIAPVPAKQPWWIWINTLCEFIMNDCVTTAKQSTTKPCAYFLGYTVNYACEGLSNIETVTKLSTFADDISVNGNCFSLILISMKYVPNSPTDNNPALRHWFRYWLGAEYAVSHYLHQRWLNLLNAHTCIRH